jgi:hypothetical protein
MRGFLAMIVGGLGLGAFLHRRRAQPPQELGPDPAAELRAVLAQNKSVTDEGTEPQAPEEPTSDLGSRRRDVHERARGAIDELR